MFHLNFLVLLLRPFFPQDPVVLVRQNGTVSSALAFGGLPRSTRLLYRLLYPHADRVICQTKAMAADVAVELGLAKDRLAVLPNPVDLEEIRNSIGLKPGLWNGPGPHLLAVGRLSREKGFDLLLRALVVVRTEFPNATLTIAGAGVEKVALQAECEKLGLVPAVQFAGHAEHPAGYFKGASAFVLSSRHEGMPNALLEAGAAGLPIVALPSSQGVVDLLCDQPGVWLATDISAEALASSLRAALRALRPGERLAHTFVEPFRMDEAIHAYEQLIDAALQEKQR